MNKINDLGLLFSLCKTGTRFSSGASVFPITISGICFDIIIEVCAPPASANADHSVEASHIRSLNAIKCVGRAESLPDIS